MQVIDGKKILILFWERENENENEKLSFTIKNKQTNIQLLI